MRHLSYLEVTSHVFKEKHCVILKYHLQTSNHFSLKITNAENNLFHPNITCDACAMVKVVPAETQIISTTRNEMMPGCSFTKKWIHLPTDGNTGDTVHIPVTLYKSSALFLKMSKHSVRTYKIYFIFETRTLNSNCCSNSCC